MKYAVITNIPYNPKEILDEALTSSFRNWVDEKGTKKHPGVWQRKKSDLTYEEAFNIIQTTRPHWVFSFRSMSELTNGREEDYWEFGGSNLGFGDYGDVFIWIQVKVNKALEIINKYNLKINEY